MVNKIFDFIYVYHLNVIVKKLCRHLIFWRVHWRCIRQEYFLFFLNAFRNRYFLYEFANMFATDTKKQVATYFFREHCFSKYLIQFPLTFYIRRSTLLKNKSLLIYFGSLNNKAEHKLWKKARRRVWVGLLKSIQEKNVCLQTISSMNWNNTFHFLLSRYIYM